MAETLTEIVARRAPSEFQPLVLDHQPDAGSPEFLFQPAPAPRGAHADEQPQRKVRQGIGVPQGSLPGAAPGSRSRSRSGSRSGSGALSSQRRRSKNVRVPELVIGLLLVAGCALAALVLQRSESVGTTIVVTARPVARGSVITAADVTGSVLVGDTSMLIAGSDAQVLLGQVAVVDISVGVPLNAAMLTSANPLSANEALTSIALQAGRMPPDLTLNDAVRVVVVNSNGATTGARMLDDTAEVWSIVGPDGSSTDTIVTLRGPLSLATEVAAATTVQISRVTGD